MTITSPSWLDDTAQTEWVAAPFFAETIELLRPVDLPEGTTNA